jgi:hypothetical protein
MDRLNGIHQFSLMFAWSILVGMTIVDIMRKLDNKFDGGWVMVFAPLWISLFCYYVIPFVIRKWEKFINDHE